MPTKVLRVEGDADKLAKLLAGRKYPMTVTWTQGALRTTQQNRLAQRWFTDVANQLGDQTHDDVRAYCKLHFGVLKRLILCPQRMRRFGNPTT